MTVWYFIAEQHDPSFSEKEFGSYSEHIERIDDVRIRVKKVSLKLFTVGSLEIAIIIAPFCA